MFIIVEKAVNNVADWIIRIHASIQFSMHIYTCVMCVYNYIYIYIYIYTFIYIYIYTHIHNPNIYIYIYIFVCMYVRINVYIYIYIYISLYTHITHVYMCIENCIDACILIIQSATLFTIFFYDYKHTQKTLNETLQYFL